MKKLLYNFWPCFLLLILCSFNCSKKNAAPPLPEQIKASSYAPNTPVLKGLTANPFLRVVVQIFSGNPQQQYRKISCTINAPGLSEVQKVDAYVAGETFATTNLIGTVSPSSATFDIPVTANLQSGIHYIWLSVVLKNDAPLNNKIELHATKLIDASSKELTIDQSSSFYTKLTGVAVRQAGDENVNTYRIPGIVQTDRGTLLAVYDIRYTGSGDLPGNIDVGLSRSTDNGKTWEPMKVIMDMGAPHDQNGIGDPAILFDPITKKIFVAALWSKGNRSIAGSIGGISPDSTGQFVLVSSTDDGVTWSVPYTITPQIKEPSWKIFFQGPGSGIAMQDGKLVFAAQYWTSSNVPYSTIIYSDNQGSTWKGKILGPKSNTTESQVVETTPGTLMLNMRDNRGSFRSVATTSNMGTTWTEHSTSYNTLPDPVCMGSLIKAKVNVNGTIKDVLFFSNPNSSSGRMNITIKASLDLGQTWLPANQLLIDERQCYGYSSLTKIDETTIGILYEGTKDLYFVKVPVTEIIK
ncbi:MAG TPA: exo-alpha-sialidase [Chitinophagaceae bacterium]|nr:exo-alpha-sialidase [Chitinophagaceae bacterium]